MPSFVIRYRLAGVEVARSESGGFGLARGRRWAGFTTARNSSSHASASQLMSKGHFEFPAAARTTKPRPPPSDRRAMRRLASLATGSDIIPRALMAQSWARLVVASRAVSIKAGIADRPKVAASAARVLKFLGVDVPRTVGISDTRIQIQSR